MTEFAKRVASLVSQDWDTVETYPVYTYGGHKKVTAGFIFCWTGEDWLFLCLRDNQWWKMSGDERCGEMAPTKEAVLQASKTETQMESLGFHKI